MIAVEEKVKAVTGNKCERKLRIGGTLLGCVVSVSKEVGQVVEKLNLDVVAGSVSVMDSV